MRKDGVVIVRGSGMGRGLSLERTERDIERYTWSIQASLEAVTEPGAVSKSASMFLKVARAAASASVRCGR